MRGIEYFNPRPLGGPAKFIIWKLYTTLYVMKIANLGWANSRLKVKISDPKSFKILSKHDKKYYYSTAQKKWKEGDPIQQQNHQQYSYVVPHQGTIHQCTQNENLHVYMEQEVELETYKSVEHCTNALKVSQIPGRNVGQQA